MTGDPSSSESKQRRQPPVEKVLSAELHECGIVSQSASLETDHRKRPIRPVPTAPGALVLAVILAILLLGACGGRRSGKKVKLPPPITNPKIGWTQVGVASWYGPPYHGRKTSNGETYDMNEMTAAHKRLPFNTWLSVKNIANGHTTQVRINDRGPFVGKRIIDLSRAAATDIRMIGSGIARVRLTVVRPPKGNPRRSGRRGRSPAAPVTPRKARFDIQIGVFAKRSNAESLASRANRRGHRATVHPFTRGGAARYRVVVSGGSSGQANARLNTLKRQGFEGFLIPRPGD